MKRPLIYILLFYIFGILIGQWTTADAVVLFFLLIAITIFMYKIYKWKAVFCFPIATVIGFLILNSHIQPKNSYIENIAQKNMDIKVSAVVTDIGYTSTGMQKLIVNTNFIEAESKRLNIKLNLQVILDSDVKVQFNQILYLSGKLQCSDFVRNPAGFDETLYMRTKNIDYKMFAKLLNAQNNSRNLNSAIYSAHQKLNSVYENLLPPKEASAIKAMILGDRDNLDSHIQYIYRKAGISHILAISGLHISILSAIILSILNRIGVNRRKSSAILMVVMILYCIFTGASPSTVRAVAMITIVMVANIIYRQSDIYTSIALAALTILIYQPLYLFNSGFQLSFAAVTGIIALTPIFDRIQFVPKSIKSYINSTLAATLVTAPILAYHFFKISLIGLAVNIFVLPISSILVGFAFVTGIVGIFWTTVAKFLCGIVYFILVIYENICSFAATIPFSEILVGRPNLISIIIYYSFIFIALYYFYCTKQYRNNIKKSIIIAEISLTAIFFISILRFDTFQIVYLDVGQGDCAIIHTEDGKNIMIDGGGNINRDISEPNIGSQIVLPYLNYRGIDYLDAVFVSHPDGDHILGIIELIDYIDIKQIFVANTENTYKNKLFLTLQSKAFSHSIDLYKLEAGNRIDLKNNTSIECIYPDNLLQIENINDNSAVLYLKNDKFTFLFAGDIELEAENKIVNRYSSIDTDILKVPHHGSKTSSSQNFLNCTEPKVAIISCSKNNSYGHPNANVLERYKNMGTKLYITAFDGAITVKREKENLKIYTMRQNFK